MSNIKTFENPDFGRVRTVDVNNEPYFVGKDVAEILGYTNPTKAMQDHVDPQDMSFNETLKLSRQAGAWLINESGLYSLIMSSKLPKAREFKRWVTNEVLPSIRKHGAYMTDETLKKALTSPDFLIQLATELKTEQEKNRQLEEKIEQDRPKVIFAEAVETAKTSILVGELAKILRQNGYDIGQNRLFERLRNDGYLCKVGTMYNMPTQRSMDMGLFEIKETTVATPNGSKVTKTTKVTGKGQQYFINKFLDEVIA